MKYAIYNTELDFTLTSNLETYEKQVMSANTKPSDLVDYLLFAIAAKNYKFVEKYTPRYFKFDPARIWVFLIYYEFHKLAEQIFMIVRDKNFNVSPEFLSFLSLIIENLNYDIGYLDELYRLITII